MTEINRESVNAFAEKFQELLREFGENENVSLRIQGGNYKMETFTLRIEGRLMNGSGNPKCLTFDNEHARNEFGVKFEGDIIGSIFKLNTGEHFIVEYMGIGKYPFRGVVYETGRSIKVKPAGLKNQVLPPREDEFTTWFTVDSESIPFKKQDVYDKVNNYLSMSLSEILCDQLFKEVDSLFEKGLSEKYAHLAYQKVIQEKDVRSFLSELSNKKVSHKK